MDAASWNHAIAGLPGAHLLQTWEWAAIKEKYGWKVNPRLWQNSTGEPFAAALILERALDLRGLRSGLRVMYIPRGPLLDWDDEAVRCRVLNDLEAYARERRAIFIKIDPELPVGMGLPGGSTSSDNLAGVQAAVELKERGWLFSTEQVQFRNTVVIDLTHTDQELLANMKQKTRYNLRLAQRKGVTVRRGGQADFSLLYQMYAETSVRDDFVIRPEVYYTQVWGTFLERQMADVLIAEVEGAPVAALVLFYFAGKAYYLYGMSRTEHREKMPNYLLQWEAIRQARAAGCQVYDLWGAPDVFAPGDSLWNVFRFKEGLGGRVLRTIGAWDYPCRPVLYSLYTRLLPKLLGLARRVGKAHTRREVSV